MLDLFISCSHRDETLRDELEGHLSMLIGKAYLFAKKVMIVKWRSGPSSKCPT